MRVGYFDCFSGASGDMILGACIDAGLSLDDLRGDLAGLAVEGYTIDAQKIRKQGFAATQFDVQVDPNAPKPHRHLKDIRAILEKSKLPGAAAERAINVFTRLAEAEAAAHGTSIEKVHFHEVGAIDAIVDIAGACAAMDRLGIDKVFSAAVPTGQGTVTCEHGVMPVPAPATAALLKGVPLAPCEEMGELTTPNGAAILTTLASGFDAMPPMRIDTIGVGAGRRDGQTRPNILRLMIGDAVEFAADLEADTVLVLEANLDDVSPEVLGHVSELLLNAGALDVFSTPILMKKNRPATLLTAIVSPEHRDTAEAIFFTETTTFGVRCTESSRRKLSRTLETVDTPAGPIRIKVGRRGDQVLTASPEYEDCREAAQRTGTPLREIMAAAQAAWRGK